MKSSYASSGFTVVKFSCKMAIFFSLSQPAGLQKRIKLCPFCNFHRDHLFTALYLNEAIFLLISPISQLNSKDTKTGMVKSYALSWCLNLGFHKTCIPSF